MSNGAALKVVPENEESMADLEHRQEKLEAKQSAHERAYSECKGRTDERLKSLIAWSERHERDDVENKTRFATRQDSFDKRLRYVENQNLKVMVLGVVFGTILSAAASGLIVYYVTQGATAS